MDNLSFLADNLGEILSKSRTDRDRSQKYMAKSLGKSIGTIQNWENGYATPNIVDMLKWFDTLGLNALRYILEYIHPDTYKNLTPDSTDVQIRDSLVKWVMEIATPAEIRKMGYNVYGNTGSSWNSQVNELCALNHLPIIDRINIAENIYNLYLIRQSLGELRNPDHIEPDIEDLKYAIEKCKEAVISRKSEYM